MKLFKSIFCAGLLLSAPAAADSTSSDDSRSSPEASGGMLLLSGADDEQWLAPQVSTEVDIRVTGLLARASVEQVFENPSEEPVDAVYVFPLPETAAVDGLTLRVGERIIKGQIAEREDAQQKFETARREGKKASLVEQERPNLFTTRVANIQPGELVQVELHYQQDVRYEHGVFSLMFPSTVTPRYLPGSPISSGAPGTGWGQSTSSVPDARRVTPKVVVGGAGPLLDMRVNLDAGVPLVRVHSASHELSVRSPWSAPIDISLKDGPVLADRDFRLEWQVAPSDAPTSAVFTEEFAGERYALLMALPPEGPREAAARLPRETLFVIDTSGSMAGTSILQAQSSLQRGLEALRPEDRFNVIDFDSEARRLFESAVPATPKNVQRALGWIADLEADGGTEILSALELAMAAAPSPERVRQLVFITDGSVGNEDELFTFIRQHLGQQRLFTVGIGSAPNRHFMRGAARFGRGTFTEVGSLEEVKAKMDGLWAKLDAPLMKDLSLGWQGGAAPDVWPARLPDLYRGEPLVILAKLEPGHRGVKLEGQRSGQAFSADLRLAGAATERGIHRLWARRKIEDLMDLSTGGATDSEIRARVVPLALKHHIVSKYTSLVAIDTVRTADGPARQVAVGLALPAGSEMFGNLPQTATPGPFCLLLGMLSFALAGVVQRRGGGS